MSYKELLAVTVAGTVAALGLCLALLSAARRSSASSGQLLAALLLIGLLCRVAFALFTPIFYAPDEEAHFKYVQYVATNASLPVQTSQTGAASRDWEYYQPPLYYVSLAPLYRLSQTLSLEEAPTVRILRMTSILLWVATVIFTLKFLDRLGVDDTFVRTFTMGMVALLPTYSFLSSAINNDNMLIALGSGMLCLAVSPGVFPKKSVLIGVALGIALLTKLTAVVYVPFIILVSLIGAQTGRNRWTAIRDAMLAVGIAFAILAPWALRNLNLYGSLTAISTANVLHEWSSVTQAVVRVTNGIQDTFWATWIYNNVGYPYPVIGRHLSYFAVAGLLYGFLRKREKLNALVRERPVILVVFGVSILVNVVLAFRFGLLYSQSQGRFLYPMLLPISLLLGLGIRMLSVSDHDDSCFYVAGLFVVYCVSFLFFSLATFTRV